MKTRNYSLQQRINRTEAIYHALGEAAYEGNIGAVEVAQFYMNADDNQIQEFETELDNGNETEAWDIVQRFHGVDLVGIGSDQPSPRAERVAGQIDEYFNKKNNKKTLTYELLYEMVKEQVLAQESSGAEYSQIVKQLVAAIQADKNIKSAEVADTTDPNKVGVTGMSREERIAIGQNDWLKGALEKIAPGQAVNVVFRKKEGETDIVNYADVGDHRINFKQGSSWKPGGLQLESAVVDVINNPEAPTEYFNSFCENLKHSKKHKFGKAEKLDSGKISKKWSEYGGTDATSKSDIVIDNRGVSMKMGADAMLFGFGPGDAQACMAVALEKISDDNEIKNSPAAQELTEALANMEQAIGRAPLGTLKKARDVLSAAEKDGTFDKEYGDASADDVLTQVDSEYKMSPAARKNLAQLLDKNKQKDQEAYEEIKGYIADGVLALPGGETGPEAAEKYELGTSLEVAAGAKPNKKQRDRQDYKIKHDDRKQKVMGIETARELLTHAKKILELEQGLESVDKQMKQLMKIDSPDGDPLNSNELLRREYFREALTGAVKFGNSVNTATMMFVTQGQDKFLQVTPENVDNYFAYKPLDDEAIEDIMRVANFRGKFRSDSIKRDKKKTGYNLYRSSIIAEIKTSSEQGKIYLQKLFGDSLNEGLITESEYNNFSMLLTEGMLGDMWSGVKKYAKLATNKAGEVAAKMKQKLSDFFKGIVTWFENLYERVSEPVRRLVTELREALSGGMKSVMEFFGVTFAELGAAFEPEGDSNGDQQAGDVFQRFIS